MEQPGKQVQGKAVFAAGDRLLAWLHRLGRQRVACSMLGAVQLTFIVLKLTRKLPDLHMGVFIEWNRLPVSIVLC